MPRSQNGWLATPSKADIQIKPLVVAGVNFAPGVAHHSYADVVLKYVAEQYHYRVEKLRQGWCWGYYYRANRNSPNSLSNHSSGTAIDCNAPLHPNGVSRTKNFSNKQIAEIHKILSEVNSTSQGQIVRWGGDYTRTVDSMHFEVVGSPAATTVVGKAIIAGTLGKKVGPVPRVIDFLAPSRRPAVASGVIRVGAVTQGANNADVRELQVALNKWYPREKIAVDGIYGAQTWALFDYARHAFGLPGHISDPNIRRKTLQKLGFKTYG